MRHLKLFFTIVIISYVSSCNNKQTKKIGNYFVRANFVDDININGEAEYFDNGNRLVSRAFYKNGLKEGPALNYFANGVIRDSLNYTTGLLNGWQFSYRTNGKLLMRKFSYYGLYAGGCYYYSDNLLTDYLFSDFDKKDLFDCSYDSLFNCKITSVDLAPSFNLASNDEKDSALEVLIYFPHPPGLSLITSVGLINRKEERINERRINSNRLFLDTALNCPDPEWNYYVSYHVRDNKGAINKLYFYLLHR